MGMLLTETQRKWVNILKEAAKKKPPAPGLKPKVSYVGKTANLSVLSMP